MCRTNDPTELCDLSKGFPIISSTSQYCELCKRACMKNQRGATEREREDSEASLLLGSSMGAGHINQSVEERVRSEEGKRALALAARKTKFTDSTNVC